MLRTIDYLTFGGYEEAERKMILIGAEEGYDFSREICIARITASSKIKLSHRGILGSVLGLGVKREMIGDIIVGEEFSDIIILRNISEFLENNLKYVGKEKVKVEIKDISKLQETQEKPKEITTSVSSLRLDSIISAGFGVAREKSNLLVKGEAAKVNHMLVKSPMKQVKEGDAISVRGKRKTHFKGGFRTNKK